MKDAVALGHRIVKAMLAYAAVSKRIAVVEHLLVLERSLWMKAWETDKLVTLPRLGIERVEQLFT